MIKEEAIEELKWDEHFETDPKKKEALETAIKSLEQEPCEDAISRQAVLNLQETFNVDGINKFKFVYASDIKNLPSVTPMTVTEFADRCRECGKMRKGKWLWLEKQCKLHCTECGYKVSDGAFMEIDFKYCPNCGAYMKGEE